MDALDSLPDALGQVASRGDCVVPLRREHRLEARSWLIRLPNGEGFAAWCRRVTQSDTTFDIAVAASPSSALSACPEIIRVAAEYTNEVLAALTLPREAPYPIAWSEYHEVAGDSVGDAVQEAGSPAGTVIMFGAVDVGNLIACHQGRWVMAGFD